MPRHLRNRAQLTASSDSVRPGMPGRPRRLASGTSKPDQSPTVVVARSTSTSPVDSKKSIRLHFKMPSNKLRDATASRGRNARDHSEPVEPLRPARSTRAKRAVVIDSGSSDDEDEDEEEDEDEDNADEDGEEDAEGEEDEDAEGEEEDAGGEEDADEDAEGEIDVDMRDAPPPPPIIKRNNAVSKPTVTVTPAPPSGNVKSIEAKEMHVAGSATSDEELSELDSDEEGEGEEGEGEEDAEGEEVDEDETMGMGDGDEGDEGDDDDAEGDSDDDETPGSRGSTPDINKMTKRQRSRLDQVMGNDFLQLPMEPQIKKHLTEEEHVMRRQEMARRRKNLSEKRNEEEKMDTINRLLKKQAPKRRGKISAAEIAAGADTPDAMMVDDKPVVEKADPVFTRWISRKEGVVLGIPAEWKDSPVGAWAGRDGWKVVEEVEG